MKAKWGALVVDGRGKLGGHVASKNRSGSYFRTKVTPVNPQTSYQSAVRASFAAFSQAWSALSATLILAWNNAVNDWSTTDIFGDLKNPTGKNLFLRLNQQATQAGFASFTAVPAKAEMSVGEVTATVFDISDTSITFTGLSDDGISRVMIFSSGPVTNGTTFVKNKLRKIYDELNDSVIPANVYTAYVAKFGTPTAGDKVYFGFKYVLSSGQASPMQTVSTVVVA